MHSSDTPSQIQLYLRQIKYPGTKLVNKFPGNRRKSPFVLWYVLHRVSLKYQNGKGVHIASEELHLFAVRKETQPEKR